MAAALAALLVFLAAASDSAIESAAKALDQEDYAKAAELLEKVVAAEPDNHNARFNLAFAYTEIKQLRKAIKHYEVVVEQQPELTSARVNLSSLLMQQEEFSQAVSHLEVLAAARPDDFQAQFFYAHALLRTGQHEEAIGPYEQALTLDPDSADANLELGQSLARLKRFAEAAKYYRHAIDLDPKTAEMILELAELVERDGRIQQAVDLYQDHLKSHPEAIAVRERAGFLMLELERFAEAIRLFEEAVKQNATAANQAALAEAYSSHQQPDKALAAWHAATVLDPARPELRVRYADALVRAKRYKDAADEFLAALEQNADLAGAWNGLAFSSYQLNNFKGALRALDESRKRGGEKPATLYLRAIVEDNLEMRRAALASYEAFLAARSGLEDEEWKSEQRIKTLQKILRKGGR